MAVPNPEALVFDVQRFSIHDGPGIRTTVFFKGCPLRCRWCQNPESLRPQPEIAFYADRCRGTHECHPACERDAIQLNGDRVERQRCDGCGRCAEACPHEALRLVGRKVSIEALLEEILRDRAFYESSGGGVTLSGGEPTLQMEFMSAFARRCRDAGVAVGLQTCGLFRWDAFSSHLPLLAFIQFDLKVIEGDEHRRITGSDNRVILENARHLVAAHAPVLFRLPVIPGMTDLDSNLHQIAAFLREVGTPRIHLLRYHAMGEAKLPRIGNPLPPLGIEGDKVATERLSYAADLLRREGLEVTT